MEISRWRAASFWTAATTGIFRTAYRFCTVTIWKTMPCLAIWIYTRTRTFFQRHRTGTLMTPDTQYTLETLAVLVLDAGDDVYFEPQAWNGKLDAFLAYTREHALYFHVETMNELEKRVAEGAQEAPRLLVLSTCSSEFSNARTLVLTVDAGI